MARQHPDVPQSILDKLRLICLDLPEAYEERAWTGVRWSIAKKSFAHVVWIEGGFPPAYARAAGTEGPACVLTFRIAHPTAESPHFARTPYFSPPWFTNIVGLRLDETTDWAEASEHLIQSYRVLAPKKLTALLDEA